MRRILLATAVTLAAMSSVQPAFAGVVINALTMNALTMNGFVYNGVLLNGILCNGFAINSVLPNDLLRHAQSSGTSPLDGSVDHVTSIVLPSGEIIRH
jgi:hypothetical protein